LRWHVLHWNLSVEKSQGILFHRRCVCMYLPFKKDSDQLSRFLLARQNSPCQGGKKHYAQYFPCHSAAKGKIIWILSFSTEFLAGLLHWVKPSLGGHYQNCKSLHKGREKGMKIGDYYTSRRSINRYISRLLLLPTRY
jgi:hypothetical protein